MRTRTWSKLFSALALCGVITSQATAVAAPFAIQYTGTVSGGSGFPSFPSGSTYHAVLVFDNGGATAANQAWTGANLTCAYFANTSGSAAYAQNLVATPPGAAGSATTDAAGVLTANFTDVDNTDNAPNAVGFAPIAPVAWFDNNVNDIFYENAFANSFGDAAGGVQMAPSNWTNPTHWTLPCTAAAYSTFVAAGTRVPTLSEWNLMIMAGLLAIGGFLTLRRYRRS